MKNIIKKNKVIFIIILSIVIAIVFFTKYFLKNNTSELKDFSNTEAVSTNSFWCSTFQIAWEELKTELNLSKIEFVDEDNELVNKLNNTTFGLNSISDKDYYLFVDDYNIQVSNIINRDLKQKFNIKTKIFDNLKFENLNGKIIYSYLEKKYTFKNKFDTYNNSYFTTNKENSVKVKKFGIYDSSNDNLLNNIESSYYIDLLNYGICLNTEENEEIILIMTNEIEENFEVLWQKYKENQAEYQHEFDKYDELSIPYINIDGFFNYNDLCYKYIKDTEEYIECALQNVKLSLNEFGGKLENEVNIKSGSMSSKSSFYFSRPFVVFIKEKEKEDPYFALKIFDESFLMTN